MATRIKPLSTESAGEAASTLSEIENQLGMVPNLYATLAHSPAVLNGFLGYSQNLANGSLPPALREQIALAVAGVNACDYCASAHAPLAKRHGVNETEVQQNLRGESADPAADAVLAFVTAVVRMRGRVNAELIDRLRDHGFSDREIVEIVAHIGANLFTNYFNHIAATTIDFPFVAAA